MCANTWILNYPHAYCLVFVTASALLLASHLAVFICSSTCCSSICSICGNTVWHWLLLQLKGIQLSLRLHTTAAAAAAATAAAWHIEREQGK
jgi:hypothetical protein